MLLSRPHSAWRKVTARVWLVKSDLLGFPRVSGWRIFPWGVVGVPFFCLFCFLACGGSHPPSGSSGLLLLLPPFTDVVDGENKQTYKRTEEYYHFKKYLLKIYSGVKKYLSFYRFLLFLMSKWLNTTVSFLIRNSFKRKEKKIYTVFKSTWLHNLRRLRQSDGWTITQQPSCSTFLSVACKYISRKSLADHYDVSGKHKMSICVIFGQWWFSPG